MPHEKLDRKGKLVRVLAGGGLIFGSSVAGMFLLDRYIVRLGGGVLLAVAFLIGFMLLGEAFLGAKINLASGNRDRRRR